MNCPRCNEPLNDKARFCSNCGLSFASFDTPTEHIESGAKTLPAADPLIGHVLDGKYELLARLGEGGMGAVYRARRKMIGDEVAVKVLLQKYVAETAAVERFRREARAAAMLRHPNVVAIYDFGEARGDDAPAYIVMELVEGHSLRDLLKREGKLKPERAVHLMRQICAGVGAAHRRGIWHRDLKPDNIIVAAPDEDNESETVKVVDFGIAKLRDFIGEFTLTQTGAVIGTPYYMSPEQCKGETLDARSDVYSLSAVLYEMLNGAPPFTARTSTGVVAKHLTETPPPLEKDLKVPPALEAVIMKALAKDADARQQDASAFAREIQTAMQATEPEITKPKVDWTQPSPRAPEPAPVGQAQQSSEEQKHDTSPEASVTTDNISLSKLGLDSPATETRTRGSKGLLFAGLAALIVVGLGIAALSGVFSGRSDSNNTATQTASPTSTPSVSGGILGKSLGVLTTPRDLYEVALSPDGKTLASTGDENRVRLWRVSDRAQLRELTGYEESGRCVAISPDGQMVASGNDDGAIRIWHTNDGQLIHTLQGHTKFVFIVSFSRDGQTLVSASADKTVRVWRVRDGSLLATITPMTPSDLIINISPDQKTIALFGSDRSVKLMAAEDSRQIRTLTGHHYQVTGGAFSPDNQILALGSEDGMLRLWRVSDGTLLRTLEGTKGEVGSVTFSPDGQTVAAGWGDGIIRMWRVSDGNPLKTLEGHKKTVHSLAFSSDGKLLASGSDDKTVRLWQISE